MAGNLNESAARLPLPTSTMAAYGLDRVEQGCRFLGSASSAPPAEHLLRALSYCQSYACEVMASCWQQKHQLSLCYQSLATLQQQLEQERTEHASTRHQLEHERDEHSRADHLLQEERLGHGAARAELNWQAERISVLETHSANAHAALQECGSFADDLAKQLAALKGEWGGLAVEAVDTPAPNMADLLLELTSLRSMILLLQENGADGRIRYLLEENALLRRRNQELQRLVNPHSDGTREMAAQVECTDSRVKLESEPDAERGSNRSERVKQEENFVPVSPGTLSD